MSRNEELDRLYAILDDARERFGGYRYLSDPLTDLPRQGVYFIFDADELRQDGGGFRVVRVGTHAVSAGSRATLSGRLVQHRGPLSGTNPGGGNHRGSVFRRHVGRAMLARDGDPTALQDTWGLPRIDDAAAVEAEQALERAVSTYIRALPLLWIPVIDPAGSTSQRAVIERGAIALLSSAREQPGTDRPSPGWLGLHSPEPRVRSSGLWNVNHVGDTASTAFLDVMELHMSGRPSAARSPLMSPPARSRSALPRHVSPTSGAAMSDELYAAIRSAVTVGETVMTVANGHLNRVVTIAPTHVLIETDASRDGGKGAQPVSAWMLQRAWDHLASHGTLTQAYTVSTNGLNIKRSAAVLALLAQLPDVDVVSNRPATLAYRPTRP